MHPLLLDPLQPCNPFRVIDPDYIHHMFGKLSDAYAQRLIREPLLPNESPWVPPETFHLTWSRPLQPARRHPVYRLHPLPDHLTWTRYCSHPGCVNPLHFHIDPTHDSVQHRQVMQRHFSAVEARKRNPIPSRVWSLLTLPPTEWPAYAHKAVESLTRRLTILPPPDNCWLWARKASPYNKTFLFWNPETKRLVGAAPNRLLWVYHKGPFEPGKRSALKQTCDYREAGSYCVNPDHYELVLSDSATTSVPARLRPLENLIRHFRSPTGVQPTPAEWLEIAQTYQPDLTLDDVEQVLRLTR